ncbi:MAG: DUF1846 domain-containing protein [Clostridia bacterium]|nr:DUF1846 domain-containing protein [Clostridia bacterium]
MKICFDNEKYEKLQSEQILERVKKFSGKLYLEFGGKLFDDLHASRVLPGFRPDAKVRILQKLSDKTEIIMVVGAPDVERKKIRADYGISYDEEVIRQIAKLRELGLYVSTVLITMYNGQKNADKLITRLKNLGERVYVHTYTKGYPDDVATIVSPEGYGANPYIETTRPIVVVTAPGPGSGKMSTCLSQMYHESTKGIISGYAKFETFPIWNLPVDHPVNLAYMAATADLKDKNLIDTYHLRAYKKRVTNYNRDLQNFAVLQTILSKIAGDKIYNSPTDMGVNMAGFAITDDKGCMDASYNEIIRRYYKALCDEKLGVEPSTTATNILEIIKKHDIDIKRRRVIFAANNKFMQTGFASVAIELSNTSIVTGRETDLLSAASSAVLNCLKEITDIDDDVYLLGDEVCKTICELKSLISGGAQKLDIYDTLCALAICSATNKLAKKAFDAIGELKLTDAHSSHILSASEQSTLKKLGINISCEPEYLQR